MKILKLSIILAALFIPLHMQAAAGSKGLLPKSNRFQKHILISERALPLATAFKLLGAGCVVSAQFLPTDSKVHKGLMGSAAFIMAVADPVAKAMAAYELQ